MEYQQNTQTSDRRKQIAAKRRKKRKQRIIRFFVGFIILSITVALLLGLTVLFPITSVSASGSNVYTNTQIIEASGITVGENVFMSGGLGADNKITKKLPYIKTASIKRSFSGNIDITVTDTVAEICYYSQREYYLCDADNKILEKISIAPKDVLEIRLSDKINGETGEYIDFSSSEDRFLADKIFSAFKAYDIDVQIIDISDDLNIRVLADNRLVLLFGTKSEFEGKLAHFIGMHKKMSKDVSGIVTLTAWSSNKQEAYFKESKIDEYFTAKDTSDEIINDVESDVSTSSTSEASSSDKASSSNKVSTSSTSVVSKVSSSKSNSSSKKSSSSK